MTAKRNEKNLSQDSLRRRETELHHEAAQVARKAPYRGQRHRADRHNVARVLTTLAERDNQRYDEGDWIRPVVEDC